MASITLGVGAAQISTSSLIFLLPPPILLLAFPSTLSSSSISASSTPSASTLNVYCGGGDRKTAEGKRFNHWFGNSRLRKRTTEVADASIAWREIDWRLMLRIRRRLNDE